MGNACCASGRSKKSKVTQNVVKVHDAEAPDNVTRVLFRCGEHCGFGCAPWESGIVHHVVPNSQAEAQGVCPGWRIHSLDNETYSFETLMEKMKGRKSYEIAFFETNHFFLEEVVTFEAGGLGVKCDNWDTGVITVVSDGAGKEAGVKHGWKFASIDGGKYSEELLDKKLAGTKPFKVTFLVPMRRPEYKEVTLEFKTGQVGIGCEDWNIGYVTDSMPDTQAWEKGVQLGWKIDKLDGEAYVASELDKKLEGDKDYELTFLVPVDIVLSENKGPQVISEVTIKQLPGTKWEVVNGKGVVVREDMDNTNRNSSKVATLPFGEKLEADQLVGKRLHITKPVEGWVSLKNQKGYVLVEGYNNRKDEI